MYLPPGHPHAFAHNIPPLFSLIFLHMHMMAYSFCLSTHFSKAAACLTHHNTCTAAKSSSHVVATITLFFELLKVATLHQENGHLIYYFLNCFFAFEIF